MNKREFAILAAAMKTYYPKENGLLPNQQAMDLWYRELQDIPMEVAETALRKWVSTNKWSPSIAELREAAADVQNGEMPDWTEGWEQVCFVLRRYGYYNPKEGIAALDPITRECVKRLGYNNLCLSENPAADRANFRQCFETLARREQARRQLSLPVRQTIQRLQHDHLALEGGEDGG